MRLPPSIDEELEVPWTAPGSHTTSARTLHTTSARTLDSDLGSVGSSAVSNETRKIFKDFIQGYLQGDKEKTPLQAGKYQESLKMLALDKTPEPEADGCGALEGDDGVRADDSRIQELADSCRKPPTAPASFGGSPPGVLSCQRTKCFANHPFKDHYTYFAHHSKSGPERECAQDRDMRLNAQLSRQRRQRIVFAPSKAPLKRIGEEEAIGSSEQVHGGQGRDVASSPVPSAFDMDDEERVDEEPSSKMKAATEMVRRMTITQKSPGEPSTRKQAKDKAPSRKEELGSTIKAAHNNLKQKEACESLRYLVFGCLGNESMTAQEKHMVYDARVGKKEEVFQLYSVWSQMDEDGSGDIELQEFLNFFSANKADRLLGMRCVKYLLGTEGGKACTIEDMMHLIWLKATPEDITVMMRWFREAAYHQKRAPTPPLLPKRKRRELIENFRWINKENKGTISYQDLVDSGLVDSKMADDLMSKYDLDGSNDLDCNEFLELLCPNGYRAHADATQAVDKKGNQLCHMKNEYFEGWVVEGAFDNLPENLRIENLRALDEEIAGAEVMPSPRVPNVTRSNLLNPVG